MVFIDSDLLIKCIRPLNPKKPEFNKQLLRAREVMDSLFQKYKKIKITLYNYVELYKGAYLSEKVANNLHLVEIYCSKFDIVLPTLSSAKEYAKISANLESKGIIVGIFDMLIASIVIINRDILLTKNLDHFVRIPEIQCDNWETFLDKKE
jgi:tRNA(fMet)-specific endonuclease VapC